MLFNNNGAAKVQTSSRKSATPKLTRSARKGRFVVSKARVEAVMQAAKQVGLLQDKGGRIGGRASPNLVRQAKRANGSHN